MRKLKSQKLFMALTIVIKQSDCPHLKNSCSFPEQRGENAALCLPWGRGESWFKMHIPNSYVPWLGTVTEVQIPVRHNSVFAGCRTGARVHSQQAGQRLSHKIWAPLTKLRSQILKVMKGGFQALCTFLTKVSLNLSNSEK